MFLFIPSFGLRLTFEENSDFPINKHDAVSILELSSLLYDFNLLHDCVTLTALKDYNDYRFTQYFWYRKGRPLKPEHQLYLNKIHHKSPLMLEVLLPATLAGLTIPWLIIQATEKICNWRLNREKLKLEVENLR